MTKSRFLLAGLLAAGLSIASIANAGDQDFTIVNETGMALGSMYVAPESDAKSWGSELFKGKVLPSGNKVDITFSAKNTECEYAIAFKDSDDNEYEIHNVDLCAITELRLSKSGNSILYKTVK
ncbi:MAG: hypothetical protein H7293_06845 [Candidatus Saccharibacteria bacterium]|nr:hypothetical protein [Rhodoferax sp.]